MLTLAIDTSDRHFSLALLVDQSVVAELDSREFQVAQSSNSPKLSNSTESAKPLSPGVSVTLFPALQQLLIQAGKNLNEVDLIAIATGPGLFTGLRVGVVAAKTWAYSLRIPLVGVNSLAVIASRSADEFWDKNRGKSKIYPILNAQRQQLFGGIYQMDESAPGRVRELQPNQILDRDVWLKGIEPGAIVSGTGLSPLISTLSDRANDSEVALEQQLMIAPEPIWECHAVGVGRIGWQLFQAGHRDDFWTLEPFYFRPSYAEESPAT